MVTKKELSDWFLENIGPRQGTSETQLARFRDAHTDGIFRWTELDHAIATCNAAALHFGLVPPVFSCTECGRVADHTDDCAVGFAGADCADLFS